jgi:hypothetical protein
MKARDRRTQPGPLSLDLCLCVVDSTLLKEQLEQTERLVLEGERRIARQRQMVAELECDRQRSWWDATELLRLLEESQALHVADRDRLRKELGF